MSPEEEIKKLKELLWLRHGCSISALYGDDGEMQCASCLLDFKRMTAEEIELRWQQIAIERYATRPLNANFSIDPNRKT